MAEGRDLAEFNLVYGQASDLAKGFPDSQFKTLGALFVVIGWLLTASTAQSFIKAQAALSVPATTLAFALLFLLKAFWIFGYYQRAKALHLRLATLAKAQGLSYESIAIFEVKPFIPLSFLVVNLMACTAIIVIVWLICA